MEIVCSCREKVLCGPVWSCSTVGSCGTWGCWCKRQGGKWQGSVLSIVFQVMACPKQKIPAFKVCLITESTSAQGIQRRKADVKPGQVLQSCPSLRHSLRPGLKVGKCTKFPGWMKFQPAITSRLVKLLTWCLYYVFIPKYPCTPFVWELE